MTRLAVPPPATAPARGDAWISRAATATVVALAGIAGAISYSHMRQLAATHGQAGWHAHAFPLSVDGVEVVASLVLLAARRAGRRPGWLPWAALATGTAASLAANIATASAGIISRVIAGWPALALLIAVKLLSGILEHHDQGRSPAAVPVPAQPGSSRVRPGPRSLTPAAVPPARPAPGRTGTMRPAAGQAGTVPAEAGTMLAAARAARDGLRRDGRPVTRDALAARMRANGHPVRNARMSALLAAVRDDIPRHLAAG